MDYEEFIEKETIDLYHYWNSQIVRDIKEIEWSW